MGISVRCLYNGTIEQFRQEMATKPRNNQILKYNGTTNQWVNVDPLIPTPTVSDEGKFLLVNANGEYELTTILNSENIAY
jgi:hypothetical protein